MSYLTISRAATDPSMRRRIAGCIAQQDTGTVHPQVIAEGIAWRVCAEPGWAEAWDSAEAAQATKPADEHTDVGADPAVITDAMILAAVQKHLGESS